MSGDPSLVKCWLAVKFNNRVIRVNFMLSFFNGVWSSVDNYCIVGSVKHCFYFSYQVVVKSEILFFQICHSWLFFFRISLFTEY